MKKTLLTFLVVALCGIAGFYALNSYIYSEKQRDEKVVDDFRNGWYLISGEFVHLEKGVSRVPAAPGSASTITTKYFGNDIAADLDRDGDEDIAFILTQDGGGSGIFFFLAAALKEDGGYRGTNAMLIGDRILPKGLEFRDGLVVIEYADRKPGEAMAAVPTVPKTLFAKYSSETMDFGEVVQNFEGESSYDAKTPLPRSPALFSARGDLTDPKKDWIAIVSNDETPVALGGWTVRSAVSGKSYLIPATVPFRDTSLPVSLNGTDTGVFIHTAGTKQSYLAEAETHLYFHETHITWGEFHDAIELVDPSGRVIDRIVY